MSDVELISDNEEDVDLQLVTIVRNNRFLYDKTDKMYANVSLKNRVWTRIGSSLSTPIEGKLI